MKKLFLLLTLSFMFFSFTSLNIISKNENIDLVSQKCEDRAYIVMHQAYNAGYSDDEVFWYMNVAYALCEGYTMADINL